MLSPWAAGVHDIMKLASLCPTVRDEDSPYHGHLAGDRIIDHDLALAYVLEHDVGALPSVAALPAHQQAAVRFTQADLCFNHGHLVQAEAPPGALFARFKALLTANAASPSAIAFYFVHWLTDLAGAEPTPLRGCEKFVLKFPQPVLARLLSSMPLVTRLATTSMSGLYEEYLRASWPGGTLGPPPTDQTAPALMRLMLQAQEPAMQRAVHDAFHALGIDARRRLVAEMALTGTSDEVYSFEGCRKGGGPAFLIYYSPAYVRHCCALQEAPPPASTAPSASALWHEAPRALDEVRGMLNVLSEVYRAARVLWPETDDTHEHAQGESTGEVLMNVTIMVSDLSKSGAQDVLRSYGVGHCWLLQKTGTTHGKVAVTSMAAAAQPLAAGEAVVLQLWSSEVFPPADAPKLAKDLADAVEVA